VSRFGEVVKARNTLDGRIYAVKKIRLRPSDNDARIFREVNALARLSHKSIVRYYTTWIEISEGLESPGLSRSDSGSEDRGIDDTIKTSSRTPDVFQIDLNDLTKPTSENESFPGIYFGDVSGTTHLSSDDYGSGSESESESSPVRSRLRKRIPASTLYIQMVSPITPK
jgi:translation initiation factor 2-alpha kinase 4